MQKQNFFKSNIDLFRKYYQKMDNERVKGFNKYLGCEVIERLEQLQFLVGKVHELENQHNQITEPKATAFQKHCEECKSKGVPFESTTVPKEAEYTKQEAQQIAELDFEIQLYTECFYYLAGRMRSILRHKSSPLPYLSNFECEGTRNVRNKLLEHAEGKDSQVYTRSFAFGGPQGPVIKSIRNTYQIDIFPDQGLYKNAKEIKTNLENLLKRVFSKKINT